MLGPNLSSCERIYNYILIIGFLQVFFKKNNALYFSKSISLYAMLNFIYTGMKAEGAISLEHHFVFS